MSNEGKRVRTHYTGTFDDGTVFDSSVERGEPLEFICMAGQMIPGFDAAVNEMAVGETKRFTSLLLTRMASAMNLSFSKFLQAAFLMPISFQLAKRYICRVLADSLFP